MNECSRQDYTGTTSHQSFYPPATSKGTFLTQDCTRPGFASAHLPGATERLSIYVVPLTLIRVCPKGRSRRVALDAVVGVKRMTAAGDGRLGEFRTAWCRYGPRSCLPFDSPHRPPSPVVIALVLVVEQLGIVVQVVDE